MKAIPRFFNYHPFPHITPVQGFRFCTESKNQHFIKDGSKEPSGRNLAGYALITKCCRYIPRKNFHSKELEYLDGGECDN